MKKPRQRRVQRNSENRGKRGLMPYQVQTNPPIDSCSMRVSNASHVSPLGLAGTRVRHVRMRPTGDGIADSVPLQIGAIAGGGSATGTI